MPPEKTVREILIKVSTGGNTELKALADSMSGLNNSVSKMTKSFGMLGSALGGLAAYFSVRQVVDFADSMQLLRNRINTLTGDSTKTAEVFDSLLAAANRTKTPIDDLADVYARLAVSLKSSNLSSTTMIAITETLQNTFRLSGANAQEAANASVQFSQALSLGVLRGQDFKSVLSQNAELGNVLSKALKVTRGELQKMAEAGELTSKKVLKALISSMEDVNGRASKMSTTFGQALVSAFNDFKKAIDDINQQFDLSGKFSRAIDTVKEKFTLFLAVMGVITVAAIPSMIAAFGGLTGIFASATAAVVGFGAALKSLSAANIILLALTALGVAVLYLVDNFDQAKTMAKEAFLAIEIGSLKVAKFVADYIPFGKIIEYISDKYDSVKTAVLTAFTEVEMWVAKVAKYISDYTNMGEVINYIAEAFDAVKVKVTEAFSTVGQWVEKGKGYFKDFSDQIKSLFAGERSEKDKQISSALENKIKALDDELSAEKKAYAERHGLKANEALDAKKLANEIDKNVKDPVDDKRVKLLRELNKLYLLNKISVGAYYDKLENVDKKSSTQLFKEGKEDLTKYNEELGKFKQASINRDLKDGTITLQEWNRAIEDNKMKTLNIELESGKISLQEFDNKVIQISDKFQAGSSFRSGIENYVKSVGTISQQVAGLVTQTFTHLEDAFVSFTKTGKLNFEQMTQAILDDLNRIIIRSLIIKPLAEGLLKYSGVDASSGAATSGIKKEAKGDVFGSPTFFGYGQRKLGLMGEAGPEAIMPLRRTANGDLGVQAATAPVFVNIVNNSGGQVEQRESTRSDGTKMIDILIHNKVKEGIANGQFDRTFQQAYGIRRRGN